MKELHPRPRTSAPRIVALTTYLDALKYTNPFSRRGPYPTSMALNRIIAASLLILIPNNFSVAPRAISPASSRSLKTGNPEAVATYNDAMLEYDAEHNMTQ
ncbi:hypothetical protein MHU86_20391 [Fragilaria crotonensis]|nr:hypothetical protein MHU86_20391 [Fragilaria crotonensis]